MNSPPTCMSCKNIIGKDKVVENNVRDYFCQNCLQGESLSDDEPPKTKQSTRKHRPHIKIYHNETNIFNRMFPCPEKYIIETPERKNLNINNKNSFYSLSRRPLQCPHNSCQKYIGIFTFESHFKYEHKEIPFLLTNLEARSCLEFHPQNVQFGIKHCIVLMQLEDMTDSSPRSTSPVISQNEQTHPKSTVELHKSASNAGTSPIFMLLVYKIADIQLSDEEERHFIIDDELVDEEVKSFPDNFGDKIVIWVASNILTQHSYTVAVSKLTNDNRIKYYGPINVLGEDPIKICEDGEGLIMTYFHYMRMTNNGQDALQLDVVIHED